MHMATHFTDCKLWSLVSRPGGFYLLAVVNSPLLKYLHHLLKQEELCVFTDTWYLLMIALKLVTKIPISTQEK